MRTRHSLGSLVVAVVVFLVAVTGTLELKHMGERSLVAERDLQQVVAELRTQDSLREHVFGGRLSVERARRDLDESQARAEALTEQAFGTDGGHARAKLAHVTAYGDGVDELVELVTTGRRAEARALDEQVVRPSFDALMADLDAHAAQFRVSAGRAGRLSDVGVVATVLLSVTLAAGVQSRRRRAIWREQAERHSEARYRALVDRSADLVMVTDAAADVRYLSPSAERAFGRRLSPGQSSFDLTEVTHPRDRAAVAALLARAGETGSAGPVEVLLHVHDGWRSFETTAQDLTGDPSVQGVVVTGHDITVSRALQRELEHRAQHDALTGLPNRTLLAERFDAALAESRRTRQPVALLLIDLDRFKEINDTLGHHYGDQLLVQVGARLSARLRRSDTVARLGGDEFAVLLPAIQDVAAAVAVAEQLQEDLHRPFPTDGIDLDVEASIGVVLSGRHGDDAATLVQRADIAMYMAKQRNLGVFAYEPTLDAHSPERLALLGDLRRALENDELVLHYQPLVSLRTGQVCAVEALVRWRHPQRGTIFPDAFIPLAENTGLINPLTRRVLDLALAQARRWADAGRPLQVAVNLSARNLLDERLYGDVVDRLQAHGVAPALLKLEVTESAIMTDPLRAEELLGRLARLGITLSIDDFGAGYTSLGQLKSLPVSELKVDRSFVRTMATDTSNALIVRSVIELGHNMGLGAVAEGVEDADLLSRLAGFSCDVVQGYHLSRPLPVERFDEWRATWPGLPPRATPPARPAPAPGASSPPAPRQPTATGAAAPA